MREVFLGRILTPTLSRWERKNCPPIAGIEDCTPNIEGIVAFEDEDEDENDWQRSKCGCKRLVQARQFN